MKKEIKNFCLCLHLHHWHLPWKASNMFSYHKDEFKDLTEDKSRALRSAPMQVLILGKWQDFEANKGEKMKYFENKLSQKLRERPHSSQLKFGTSAKISTYLKYFSLFASS